MPVSTKSSGDHCFICDHKIINCVHKKINCAHNIVRRAHMILFGPDDLVQMT